jgi:hypothetical protein
VRALRDKAVSTTPMTQCYQFPVGCTAPGVVEMSRGCLIPEEARLKRQTYVACAKHFKFLAAAGFLPVPFDRYAGRGS